MVRDLRGRAAVILPVHGTVPQDHDGAVVRVVSLVTGTAGAPQVRLQLSIIVYPEPFSLSSCRRTVSAEQYSALNSTEVGETDVPVANPCKAALQSCQFRKELNLPV